MKTFAIIDNNTGYVWGVTEAADPVQACRLIDHSNKRFDRAYEEVPRFSASNESGYHVYEVPHGFEVEDGQDDATIRAATAFPCIARIATRQED